MRSAEDILDLYRSRKVLYDPLHAKMQMIADVYNGRAEVPLPDMERTSMPSVPNLLAQGVDQMAGRITSVTPAVAFSSERPGKRNSDRKADNASRAITGWWQADKVMLKQKSRGRRIIAYGMAPVTMRWNYEKHRPIWHARHPMEALPSLDLQPGQVQPQDCIFQFQRTYGWLASQGYGPQMRALIGRGQQPQKDAIVTLIEYADAEYFVLMATGYYPKGIYSSDIDSAHGGMKAVVLESYNTLTESTPVVIPIRLTLDSMTGQFDNMLGMYYSQAKLMALESIAVEKGIFPDTYLVSRPNEIGKFIDGPHDGRTGRVNIIAGGDIREVQSQPGYLTNPTIDRLERAQRVTAGIPAEFGGESGSNIRTGRRGDAVLSAVIDYPVAEAQELFAFALEQENKLAMQLAKRIDGDTSRTIYVGVGNSRKPVTYVPSETFSVEEHTVSFPVTGSDMNSLIIGIGQRVGLGTMSKETAQVLDPFIDNPESEHDKIIAEGLEQALMSGIQQQAASGAIPPLVLSKVMTLVKNDKMELAEAMNRVTEEALAEQQAAQGQQGPPGTPDAAMADAAAQAMAGGMSPVPGPSQGQLDLGTLMSTLRKPAMTIQPNRGVSRGAV